MYRAAEKLSPEDLYGISLHAFVEMLEAGFTQVTEFHYIHHQAGGSPYADRTELARQVIRAAGDAGIRLTLLRVIYQQTGYRNKAPDAGQLRFRDLRLSDALKDVEDLVRDTTQNTKVRIGIAPHSVRAVHPEQLSEIAQWRGQMNLPLHVHAAEQVGEIEEVREALGMRPVEVLQEAGVLGPDTTLVHNTHCSPREWRQIAESGSRICVCPSTEADLGDGLFELGTAQEQGIPLSIGSDSQAVIDPFLELRSLDMHERLRTHTRASSVQPGQMPGVALLSMGTSRGYESGGWFSGGSLSPGMRGDCLTVDSRHPTLLGLPMKHWLAALFLHGDRSMVRHVWVNGAHQVRDGKHTLRETSRDRFGAIAHRLYD